MNYPYLSVSIVATSLFFVWSASPVATQTLERSYDGFVGRSLENYDRIESMNANFRFQWTADKADVIMCVNDESIGPTSLAKGVLDNIQQGTLQGTLTNFDGNPLGNLTLRKRLNEHRITWEGSFGPPYGQKVRMHRSRKSASKTGSVPDHALIVTQTFRNEPPFVPQKLFVYAYPRFDTFQEAFALLDSTFPYWPNHSLGCASFFGGGFSIDFGQTDIRNIGLIADKLRSSGYFSHVELGIDQYVGIPEQVYFLPQKYPHKTYREFISQFDKIASIIARDIFCTKTCTLVPMSTKGSNVRAFEIVGKSEGLHFKRRHFWEKYVISMTAYHNGGDFIIQFSIVSGFMAPSAKGEKPPAARFKELPIDDSDLSTLSSKLQRAIASALGGEYVRGF